MAGGTTEVLILEDEEPVARYYWYAVPRVGDRVIYHRNLVKGEDAEEGEGDPEWHESRVKEVTWRPRNPPLWDATARLTIE